MTSTVEENSMMSVGRNLKCVLDKIRLVYNGAPEMSRAKTVPRLVAVSKTKPKELIIAAYDEGQRHFGENYVQEMAEKSSDPLILEKCPEIRWHYIGTLQSSKLNKLVKMPNLFLIETISKQTLADKVHNSFSRENKGGEKKLKVFIQVNTSGEDNKSGVEPGQEVVDLFKHIKDNCPSLECAGLMTIGDLGHSLGHKAEEGADNPDFVTLVDCRRRIAKELDDVEEHQLELSMGMSNDYEEAIKMGSTNIRVGSSIFGARNYKDSDKQVTEKMASTQIK